MGRLVALLPLLMIVGAVAALLLRSQQGEGGSSGYLGGDPARAREIQDARALTPRQNAWRWALTVLGIVILSVAVLAGAVVVVRSLMGD